MKVWFLLLLLLGLCICNAYSKVRNSTNQLLDLQVTARGWHMKTNDRYDTAKYIELNVVVKNISKDTVRYMEWVGDAAAIFEIEDTDVKFKIEAAFNKNFPWENNIPQNGTIEYTLYVTFEHYSDMLKKFKLGMDLILPISKTTFDSFTDWDFLKRKAYAVVWSNDVWLVR